MYILGIQPDITKLNSVTELVLLGTAFAVTSTKLLTAYHVLVDEDSNTELIGQLVISRKVTKIADKFAMDAPFVVKLAEYNAVSDFAFLDLDDLLVTSFDSFIPICSEGSLPDIFVEGEELKSYYATPIH